MPEGEHGKTLLMQQHLELVVDSAKLMLWRYDTDKHQAVSIPSTVIIPGLPTNGMDNLPESLFPYLEESSIEPIKLFYRQMEAQELTAGCEIWYKPTNDREAICTRITARKITQEKNAYYCVARDITLEKLAERQYNDIMAGILQDSSRFISVIVVNISRNTVNNLYSQNRFVRALQDTDYNVTVEKFSQGIVDAKDREQYIGSCSREALLKKYSSGDTRGHMVFRYRMSAGPIHWLEISYTVTKNPLTGDIEGVSYARDVNNEMLRDEVLRRLTDWDFECIATIDLSNNNEYTYISRNDEAKDVLPHTRMGYDEEIRYVAEKMVIPEQKEDYLHNILLANVLKRLENSNKFSYNVSMFDEHGDFHNKLLHYNFIDENKKLLLLTAMDVTDTYLQHQEELKTVKSALEREEQAMQYRNLFFSNISHDMRTPLNGILGFTDLALQETDPEKMRQYLSKIKLSGGLLLDLINDTLMLSKLESGKLKPSYAIQDNRLISGRILVPIQAMAEAKGVKFIQDRSQSPHVLMKADLVNTQKIFLNLLSNAVKFTPRGGTVTIKMEQLSKPCHNCNYRFVVADTGIGINPDFLPHIYEPFVQDSSAEPLNKPQQQGTGLGLAIVKQLVGLLHGHIEVESTVGKGTTFTVYLPMPVVGTVQGEPEWVPGAAPIKAPVNIPAEAVTTDLKILLCEDNYLNMEIATILLKKKNYQVIKAVNGKEGVEKFQASQPGEIKAILMDLRMPVLNGYEATQAIRSMDRTDAKTVPIIALSADAYEEDVRKALEVGMNAHLAKPFNPQEIYSTLEKYINN